MNQETKKIVAIIFAASIGLSVLISTVLYWEHIKVKTYIENGYHEVHEAPQLYGNRWEKN